jgi:DNA primase
MSLEDLVNRIKTDYPISSILTQYMSLKKQGANHVGLCPFHKDSNPSLSVNDNKGMFKCFVCQTGGDAIKFVRDYKHYGFKEALEDICKVVGINFADFETKKIVSPKLDMARKVLSVAEKIYSKTATTGSHKAYTDFVKSRNLDEPTVNNFHIGYSNNQSQITNYLMSLDETQRKFAIDIATEIHLIRRDKNDATKYYDTFRDRIMFPIWDNYGNLSGFSSRRTKEHQKAKYLNSQESFAFNKGNILFGYNKARNEIRNKNSVIICEGHMDLIVLHQFGFVNSVATQGIALSDFGLNTLKAQNKNIYL